MRQTIKAKEEKNICSITIAAVQTQNGSFQHIVVIFLEQRCGGHLPT